MEAEEGVEIEFVVSDESVVDRHGTRIMVDGIDTTNFEKNPTMVFGHADWAVPIGKWKNIRKEGGKLYMTPVFSESTELSRQIKDSVSKGALNGSSIGFRIIEWSDDPQYLLKGQRYETITRCELYEVSMVTIPSNPNAVAVRSVDGKPTDFKQLLESRKLPVAKLPDQTQKQLMSETSIDVLIDLGKANGHITPENETHYRELAQSNYETTYKLLSVRDVEPQEKETSPEEKQPEQLGTLTDALRELVATQNKDEGDPREQWTHRDWSINDPKGLRKIQQTDPEQYAAIVNR